MQKWMFAFAAPALPVLLAGCVAHGTPSVPLNEVSAYTPDMERQMIAGRVRVSERPPGHRFAGYVAATLHKADGTWRACTIETGKSGKGTWTVTPDAHGRATSSATTYGRSLPRRTYVWHYDPVTGADQFRRRSGGNSWVTTSRGWLQDRWPQVAVDKCPGLNLGGVGVDKRQTASSLAALRRQAPDAPLKNLAQPLPKPVGKQSAAPAGGALYGTGAPSAAALDSGPAGGLSDEDRAGLLAMGVPERFLPAFADRLVTPGVWAKLVRQGFRPEHIADLASEDVATRAKRAAVQVVSVRDSVARLRSRHWIDDWEGREGERVRAIGRVARITSSGDVWLQGMSDPLPRSAR